MRLYEITNTLTPDKFSPEQIKRPHDVKFEMPDQEEIGSGMFATVFSTQQEPGTVRKVSNIMDESEFKRDAYFKYVKLLAKNDRFTSNPYFPKIYNIQVKKFPVAPDDPTTFYDHVYAVDIERLHEWGTLSHKEALMVGEKIFYDFKQVASHHIKDNTVKSNRPRPLKNTQKQLVHVNWRGVLMDFIRGIVGPLFPEKQSTIIKDPNFKKTILLIRSLKTKAGKGDGWMFYDIHSGNIMIRRAPGGPQLVFTDPVGHS